MSAELIYKKKMTKYRRKIKKQYEKHLRRLNLSKTEIMYNLWGGKENFLRCLRTSYITNQPIRKKKEISKSGNKNNMLLKGFTTKKIEYIDSINEILDYLDLSVEDKKNIKEKLIGLEDDGFLYTDEYNSDRFQNVEAWIDFTIDILEDQLEECECSIENLYLNTCIDSLIRFLKMCPENLYICRR